MKKLTMIIFSVGLVIALLRGGSVLAGENTLSENSEMLEIRNKKKKKRNKRLIRLKNGRVTASQVSTGVDVNKDGFTGNLTVGKGDSNHGQLFGRSISEVRPLLLDPEDPTSIATCSMPNGSLGLQFELAEFNGVLRVDGLNGAVYLKEHSGTVCNDFVTCFDPATNGVLEGCQFTGDWLLEIVGGIGGLKDASGFLTLKGDGEMLLADPTGNFSGFDGRFDGKIKLPKKDHHN